MQVSNKCLVSFNFQSTGALPSLCPNAVHPQGHGREHLQSWPPSQNTTHIAQLQRLHSYFVTSPTSLQYLSHLTGELVVMQLSVKVQVLTWATRTDWAKISSWAMEPVSLRSLFVMVLRGLLKVTNCLVISGGNCSLHKQGCWRRWAQGVLIDSGAGCFGGNHTLPMPELEASMVPW